MFAWFCKESKGEQNNSFRKIQFFRLGENSKFQKTVIMMVIKPSWKCDQMDEIVHNKGTWMRYYLWLSEGSPIHVCGRKFGWSWNGTKRK